MARDSITRRTFLGGTAAMGSAALLAACQRAAPTGSDPAAQGAPSLPASATSDEWAQLVEAATREGEVSVYSAINGAEGRDVLAGVFESTYPRIKVQYLAMPNVQLIARMAAERSAGRYIPDVMVGPGSTAIPAFKSDGGLAPIKPAFVLPEVLDESLWLNGRHWWMDAAPPYVALGFVGQLQPVLSYNTQLVDPREITSYWDLLNPKWKGKIVARDVRQAGPGGPQVLYQYRHPDLGLAFLERFWTEMEPMISVDARQMIDWLAQGQYVIGFSVNSRELREAGLLGLPVALIPVSQLKEGSDLTHAGGSLNLSAQAPHPNAAKLYVNWLLSREGQIAWQKHTLTPSLRQDIPKDGLDPAVLPKPGVQYTSSSAEDYGRLEDTEVEDIITRAVARNQR